MGCGNAAAKEPGSSTKPGENKKTTVVAPNEDDEFMNEMRGGKVKYDEAGNAEVLDPHARKEGKKDVGCLKHRCRMTLYSRLKKPRVSALEPSSPGSELSLRLRILSP